MVGFEPTVRGTKNRCLTTWLHPNRAALVTLRGSQDQDPCVKNLWFIFVVSNRLIIGPDIGFRSNDPVQVLEDRAHFCFAGGTFADNHQIGRV